MPLTQAPKLCPDCKVNTRQILIKSGKINTYCKECSYKRTKAWREKNKEYDSLRKKEWVEKNKKHVKAHAKLWQISNKLHIKEYVLQKKFGISLEEFHKMWDNQSGLCGICNEPMLPDGNFKNSVHVDHDHKTGKVRGLLHSVCNRKLGIIEDFNFLNKALNYLRKEGINPFL